MTPQGRTKTGLITQKGKIHDWLTEVGNQSLMELCVHFYDIKDYNLGKRSTLRGRLSEMSRQKSVTKLPSGKYRANGDWDG